MPVRIQGYLIEAKLAAALKEIVGDRWAGTQLNVSGTKRRWDMGFTEGECRVVVEFDGDEHYRNALKIKADIEKDAIAADAGLRVVRVPYWVQLDGVTFRHFFGFDAEIEREFPHGFITTKLFPASFCELGVQRFERELAAIPTAVREEVVSSLRDRVAEYGVEYVLPTALRHLLA